MITPKLVPEIFGDVRYVVGLVAVTRNILVHTDAGDRKSVV